MEAKAIKEKDKLKKLEEGMLFEAKQVHNTSEKRYVEKSIQTDEIKIEDTHDDNQI